MAEGYNLRKRPLKRTASADPEPSRGPKRRKATKKTPVSPIVVNSGNDDDGVVQGADGDHDDSAQIRHEPRSGDEHLKPENNEGHTSVAAPTDEPQNTRNAAQGSNNKRGGDSSVPRAEDRQQMNPTVPDADANAEPTPSRSDASDSADGPEENNLEARERQELSELLQEFRNIESMKLRTRHVFFTEWATNHPTRDIEEWFDYYEQEFKPAFYCYREWETLIAENPGENGENIGGRRLQQLRAIMLKLVEDRILQAGMPPQEFLHMESWDNAIARSSKRC
ncbi:hypothetical protein CERZMDRAFT_96040 [Cercospora zeae-maydis SCOH1-5]|uniref:Uncharacterized protein n=1 Tax=Cercospora zeae-maydis SCOH1-5 TaxID=717836 RepID=A0A6A6FL44_9PEZI|nr:hypothetical protein CERZMDRAFT_96040 [Cercospora zeae-maydis SCOH1-5]